VAEEFHWEMMPLTFGRLRLIWTDGCVVLRSY
jgi:hypothetical protein